jgi:hypothetical protein
MYSSGRFLHKIISTTGRLVSWPGFEPSAFRWTSLIGITDAVCKLRTTYRNLQWRFSPPNATFLSYPPKLHALFYRMFRPHRAIPKLGGYSTTVALYFSSVVHLLIASSTLPTVCNNCKSCPCA